MGTGLRLALLMLTALLTDVYPPGRPPGAPPPGNNFETAACPVCGGSALPRQVVVSIASIVISTSFPVEKEESETG